MDRLTITVSAGGDDADVRAFNAVLRDTLDTLDALAFEKTEGAIPNLRWRIVEMTKKSPPTITIENSAGLALAIFFLAGMKQLEEAPSQPFAPRAMRPASRLAGRVGVTVDKVVFSAPNAEPVSPTQAVAIHAKAAMNAKFYWVETSLEGRIEIVNIHGKPKFSIFDHDGIEIKCRFKDDMFDKVKQYINHRVIVSGRVKYKNETDVPLSIAASEIESLDEGDPPKAFSELPVIDVTGGVPSDIFVRRMRDAE